MPGAAFPHAGAGPIPALPELPPALPGPARTHPCPHPALALPMPIPVPIPYPACAYPSPCLLPVPVPACPILGPSGATFRRRRVPQGESRHVLAGWPPWVQPLTQGHGCRDPPPGTRGCAGAWPTATASFPMSHGMGLAPLVHRFLSGRCGATSCAAVPGRCVVVPQCCAGVSCRGVVLGCHSVVLWCCTRVLCRGVAGCATVLPLTLSLLSCR